MKCPKCGSKNTEADLEETEGVLIRGGETWKCKECGYSGVMMSKAPENNNIPSTDSAKKDQSSRLSKKEKIWILIILGLMFLTPLLLLI